MIEIDGSRGEGGGQILRSSLTLALVTGKAITIKNIRARRSKPGLMAQHLKAVEAAAAVGDARVEGAHLGSSSLVFEPRKILTGQFNFDIGTAGSTSLVLQTILLPLSFAGADSDVLLTGGTHVPWSPCFHYMSLHWLRYMEEIGFDVRLQLELAGFYPRGGGRIRAEIRPGAAPSALRITERGPLKRIRGVSAVANLDMSVAERQKRQALDRLKARCREVEIETLQLPSKFKGTILLLLGEFEDSRCCYYSLGARGKPAERVADEAVDELEGFLATDGAIDQYLADQLLLPLAFASGASELRTSKVTQHLLTNSEIIKTFLPMELEIHGSINQPGLIRVGGGGLSWKQSGL